MAQALKKLMPLQPKNSYFKATETLSVVLLGFFWGVRGMGCLGFFCPPFLFFQSD